MFIIKIFFFIINEFLERRFYEKNNKTETKTKKEKKFCYNKIKKANKETKKN